MEQAQPVADESMTSTEERIAVAGQWQLMWWRFRKHRLAMVASTVLIAFYAIVLAPDFFAYSEPHASDAYRSLIPPQPVHLFHDGRFYPHMHRLEGKRDPTTFRRVYVPNPTGVLPLRLLGHGYEYKLLGLIATDLHLIGVEGARAEETLFMLGTDVQGRDLWSRLMLGTQMSLSIGLVGVTLSLVVGIALGGVSGYYGGIVDTLIQRLIEVLRSIPTIPLWMGLAAAVPRNWDIVKVYLAITLIFSLIGWTELARVVRGKFLSLRYEDFVTAAELVGCSQIRIIFRHMLPSFLSHIVAATTLALPSMIISETSLSFLGLGLRPPAISWGVLLQDAQNVQALVSAVWLLIPALPVVVAILAFNFLGDGLRDAADPYGL